MVDVLEENWNAATRTLSGESVVVAGDPYELRITLPKSADWKVTRVAASDGAEIEIGQGTDRGVRVTINSEESGKIGWRVIFAE
jgi:hypothetical protein